MTEPVRTNFIEQFKDFLKYLAELLSTIPGKEAGSIVVAGDLSGSNDYDGSGTTTITVNFPEEIDLGDLT